MELIQKMALKDNNITINILAFGICKEIIGSNVLAFKLPEHYTIQQLKTALENSYPKIKELASMMLAINKEYASPEQLIHDGDEIALIPPVSGG